ncbi:MAG: dihydrofolate synthase/folylpolyglutamate synthase [Desulforhopalus sp.]|jgi:dihydrofolate synthase/folylpolyglutamate synthase
MTYDEVLAHLDALQMHKIKLGLEAMQDFLAKVGRPEKKLKCVHIAGTNGKGSVCAALSSVLGLSGYRVGVYTSPHLSSVRERFRVGDEYISEASFAEIGTHICDVLGDDQITYFEFTTALAFLWFAQSEVDLVLLETGMGGRLDATNVVTPLVSVITSISMDHEAYLGDTLAAIAGEKAGIIKPNISVVSAAIHPEVAPVIQAACRTLNAPLYSFTREFDYDVNEDGTWVWVGGDSFSGQQIGPLLSTSPSLVQQENESLAIATLLLLEDFDFHVDLPEISAGLSRLKWPGRMEYFTQEYLADDLGDSSQNNPKKLTYLLDGAHNVAGVSNLAKTIEERFYGSKLIGVWGSMVDKDLTTTLDCILPFFSKVFITQPDSERSATPEHICSLLTEEQLAKTESFANVADALEAAQKCAREDDVIVIGGSLYLIGAVRTLLCGDLV